MVATMDAQFRFWKSKFSYCFQANICQSPRRQKKTLLSAFAQLGCQLRTESKMSQQIKFSFSGAQDKKIKLCERLSQKHTRTRTHKTHTQT